jgi:hypothetical protein
MLAGKGSNHREPLGQTTHGFPSGEASLCFYSRHVPAVYFDERNNGSAVSYAIDFDACPSPVYSLGDGSFAMRNGLSGVIRVKIGRQGQVNTAICAANAETIVVRGHDLCRDLIGKVTLRTMCGYWWLAACPPMLSGGCWMPRWWPSPNMGWFSGGQSLTLPRHPNPCKAVPPDVDAVR